MWYRCLLNKYLSQKSIIFPETMSFFLRRCFQYLSCTINWTPLAGNIVAHNATKCAYRNSCTLFLTSFSIRDISYAFDNMLDQMLLTLLCLLASPLCSPFLCFYECNILSKNKNIDSL